MFQGKSNLENRKALQKPQGKNLHCKIHWIFYSLLSRQRDPHGNGKIQVHRNHQGNDQERGYGVCRVRQSQELPDNGKGWDIAKPKYNHLRTSKLG